MKFTHQLLVNVDQPADFGPTTQEYDLFNFIVDVDLGWATLGYTGSKFSNVRPADEPT